MFCGKHETTAIEESRTYFLLTLFFDRENNHVNVYNLVPTLIPKLQLGRSGNKDYYCTLFCTHWLTVQPFILDVFLQFGVVSVPRLHLDLTQNCLKAFI